MPINVPKNWSPPDHLNISERDFLTDRANTINGIVASSYLQCGQILLQVKRKFKSDPDLDGWFCRWVVECTPFSRSKAQTLTLIAEKAEGDAELIKLTDSHGYDKIYKLLLLPGPARADIAKLLQEDESLTCNHLAEVGKAPEVLLEKAQEYAEEVQMQLLQLELSIPTLNGARLYDAKTDKSAQKVRLKKALGKLQEAKEKVESLEKQRTTSEILMDVMRKKVNSQSLLIENLQVDPDERQKRLLVQCLVDATKGLDILLATLNTAGLADSDFGREAIRSFESKMEQVKQKLQAQNYAEH